MRKLWALLCVVGAACFLTFGYIGLSGSMSQSATSPLIYLMAFVSLAAALISWFKVMQESPRMHRTRAVARVRLEEDLKRNAS